MVLQWRNQCLPVILRKTNPRLGLNLNLLLERVDLDNPIGYLFLVDIFFYEKNSTEKEYLYNEIFPPIIQKQNTFDANERSAYQLLELFHKTNDKPQSYRCTAKSHATMFPKQFIPLYLEDLRFLIKRCGWKMTKIFWTICFDFVLNNQCKRQNAKTIIKKNFYELMNNANLRQIIQNFNQSLTR